MRAQFHTDTYVVPLETPCNMCTHFYTLRSQWGIRILHTHTRTHTHTHTQAMPTYAVPLETLCNMPLSALKSMERAAHVFVTNLEPGVLCVCVCMSTAQALRVGVADQSV